MVAEHDGEESFYTWSRIKECALKKSPKYSENVFQQKSYSPVTGNLGRWSERRCQIFDRKFLNSCFCACALNKSSKHSENVFWQKRYSPVTGNGGRRSERRGQIFDQMLVNRRFCACTVKNRPKTRILCCQIAKNLAPLWAIESPNTTVFIPLLQEMGVAEANGEVRFMTGSS